MTGSSTRSLRVFVNAVGIDVPPGSTVLEALRVFDSDAANAVRLGERIVTDSRGLPVDSTTEVRAGSIFRLVPKRRAADAQHADSLDEPEAE